jgi:hypothetical protein
MTLWDPKQSKVIRSQATAVGEMHEVQMHHQNA